MFRPAVIVNIESLHSVDTGLRKQNHDLYAGNTRSTYRKIAGRFIITISDYFREFYISATLKSSLGMQTVQALKTR